MITPLRLFRSFDLFSLLISSFHRLRDDSRMASTYAPLSSSFFFSSVVFSNLRVTVEIIIFQVSPTLTSPFFPPPTSCGIRKIHTQKKRDGETREVFLFFHQSSSSFLGWTMVKIRKVPTAHEAHVEPVLFRLSLSLFPIFPQLILCYPSSSIFLISSPSQDFPLLYHTPGLKESTYY